MQNIINEDNKSEKHNENLNEQSALVSNTEPAISENKDNSNLAENSNKKSKNRVLITLLVLGCIGIALVCLFFFIIRPAKEKTIEYNECVTIFNKKANEFNEIANLVDVNNISGMANRIEQLPLQDSSYYRVIRSLLKGNSLSKISKDINTIKNFTKDIEEDIVVLYKLNCPTKEWVIERLKTINLINGIESVTKDNDPNGLLGKDDGGYKDCIYFSLSNIKQNEVDGDSIVDKGTDCGGAIEIFKTKEDAEARCEYLSEYDNTILYSGSYAIVGTMVVRVSYILTNEQQYYITDLIVSAFTAK